MANTAQLFDPYHKPDGYYACNRTEMLGFIPDEVTRALDVGCGAGEFGQILRSKRAMEIWGIEICKEAAEEAKTKLDNVIIGNIENDDLFLPPDYFDCIVFNDVLEHLKYPWVTLKKLHTNLKPGGYIVASIPNVRYYENIKDLLIRRQWRYVDAGLLDKTHLRFFTVNSIKDMFEQCGYHVMNITGINGMDFPWAFRILNRIMKRAFEDMRYLQFACVARKDVVDSISKETKAVSF